MGATTKFKPKADRELGILFDKIGVPENDVFIPDEFQLSAVKKIMDSDVLVSAPTGSGKTWIAVQAIKKILNKGLRAWYASPLKALSNSKFHEFEEGFGKENVGVITGDRKENTDAPLIVGTTEILRNQLYDSMVAGADFKADLVVLDEAHFLGDKDRGVVWEEVMIYLPKRVRLLLLSATIQNDTEIAGWLTRIRRHVCHVVRSDIRPVPIHPLYLLPTGEIVPLAGRDGISHKIKKFLLKNREPKFRRFKKNTLPYNDILATLKKFNLLPAIFFLKSRNDCNKALLACKENIISSQRSNFIKQRLDGLLLEYPFLADHPQIDDLIFRALGSHNGGQLPHWKIVVEKLMNEGCLDAIFSTSTVAAGVNFPARSAVLTQSDRFNGKEFVSLTANDLHQQTGRAGRRGKDRIAFAVLVHGPFQDPYLINDLITKPPDPIDSRIKINFSMCLNLLLSHAPDEICKILNVSFAGFQKRDEINALEKKRDSMTEELSRKMQGCCCENYAVAIDRIEKRQSAYKRLTQLNKKRKNYKKGRLNINTKINADYRLADMNNKIDSLTKKLQGLPCCDCPVFALCHQGKSNHLIKLLYKTKNTAQTLDIARNALWYDFSRHLSFLILNGFAYPDGKLSQDGTWAAKLRLDQPLIIAELIRKGMLNQLTPELLAAVLAVFVNDKFRDIVINSSIKWNKLPLQAAYQDVINEIEDLVALKNKHGFKPPLIQFWPAAALYNWAGGESWDNVIKLTSVDEGDLAMLIYRTADNLRQLISLNNSHPQLAEKARKSVKLLLRAPVVIPS